MADNISVSNISQDAAGSLQKYSQIDGISLSQGDSLYKRSIRSDIGDINKIRYESSQLSYLGSQASFKINDDNFIDNEISFKELFTTFLHTYMAKDDDNIIEYTNAKGLISGLDSYNSTYMNLLRKLLERQIMSGNIGKDLGDDNSSVTNVDNKANGEYINILGNNNNIYSFDISLRHLKDFNKNLYLLVIYNPSDSIVFMDEVIEYEIDKLLGEEYMKEFTLPKVRLYDNDKITSMRDIEPNDIEQMVSVRGIIVRCSDIIPEMQKALFKCKNKSDVNGPLAICNNLESRMLIGGEIDEPVICNVCNSKYSYELIHNSCVYINKQMIKVQELPDMIPPGETPSTMLAYVYDEMVDICRPGDRVELTGIIKTSGARLVPRMRILKSVYRIYMDILHINKNIINMLYNIGGNAVNDKNMLVDNNSGLISIDANMNQVNGEFNQNLLDNIYTKEMVESFHKMAKEDDIYERLANSIAPNIWENTDVKKGLLCQLFGASKKNILYTAQKSIDHDENEENTNDYYDYRNSNNNVRTEINILLCGDPSTAKSQLLQYINKISDRGYYISGKGSSAVGLTAYITRDIETKELILESGALVLSDRGICCIDEFDKMDDISRSILHEVMEQQTISIAKAGIICSLNARVGILASANPINSRYNVYKSVIENINLPPSLISRFDLIYLLLDNNIEENDRRLAFHLCSLYSDIQKSNDENNQPNKVIDKKTLSRYISYCKHKCNPKLSQEACNELINIYLDMRKQGMNNSDGKTKNITATPRQLESLIRISESLTKMKLNDYVLKEHVLEAARLMKVATYSTLIDPITGKIDMEQLLTGLDRNEKELQLKINNQIISILTENVDGCTKEALFKLVTSKLVNINNHFKKDFDYTLDLLINNDTIRKLSSGKYILKTV